MTKPHTLPFITIIVVARNAERSIKRCIDALLGQNYPGDKIEILVVDDHSIDDTRQIISMNEPHVKLLAAPYPPAYKSRKKSALKFAVAHASGEVLFFTDADCFPDPNWVVEMLKFFQPETGLVAGFSPQRANGCWNGVLKIDAAATAFVAAGTIAFGRGVTCTGRNLAVRREALQEIGGYDALPDSLSGDDDFVLQAISAHPSWDVRYAWGAATVVPADGPENLRLFLRQKKRHISAGRHFSRLAQTGYAIHHGVNLFLWLGFFVSPFSHWSLALPFLGKLCFDCSGLYLFLHRFSDRPSFAAFLLWQPLYLYYNFFVGPLALVQKIKWSGTRVEQGERR